MLGSQRALLGGDLSALPATPPCLSTRLADDVTLVVRYHSPDAFDFEPTIAAASVDRDYQVELSKQLKARYGALSAAKGGKLITSCGGGEWQTGFEFKLTRSLRHADTSPLFDIVSTLREWIATNPAPPTTAAKRRSVELEALTQNAPTAQTSLRLKVSLLWSHHLLASTSSVLSSSNSFTPGSFAYDLMA